MLTLEFQSMSTSVLLMAEGEGAHPQAGLRQAQELVLDYARRLTRFSPDSELAALNRRAGAWHAVAPDLFELLLECRRYYQATEGLFDPAILPDLIRAGYDRSIEIIRQQGAYAERQPGTGKRSAGFAAVKLDAENQRVRLPAGVQLDLGGIAKGWIAGQALQRLSNFCTAGAVDAGGDIALAGLPAGQPAWEVGLEDPLRPDQTLGVLHVGPGAVATSSVSKRRWLQGQQVRHHLIDPRTGQPAVTDWVSVTALAPTPAAAEVFAKALLIAGSADSDRLACRAAELGLLTSYLGVRADGTLWGASGSGNLRPGLDFLEVSYDVIPTS